MARLPNRFWNDSIPQQSVPPVEPLLSKVVQVELGVASHVSHATDTYPGRSAPLERTSGSLDKRRGETRVRLWLASRAIPPEPVAFSFSGRSLAGGLVVD